MLYFFRTNQFLLSIFLIIYAVIIRYAFFIDDLVAPVMPKGVLSESLFQKIDPSSTTAGIVSIVLLVIQGIILNQIITSFRMSRTISLFPGLFYILFASFGLSLLPFSSALIANTFTLLAVYQLMSVYKRHNASGSIFNAGFLLSIASLFHIGALSLIVVVLFGLNSLRGFKLKELVILILGLVTPYYLVGTYAYWYDILPLMYSQQISNFGFFDFHINWDYQAISLFSLYGLLSVIALMSYRSYNLSKDMHARKNISILYYALFFTGLIIFFQKNVTIDDLLLISPYLGILLSFNFINLENTWAELWHGFIFIGAVVLQYIFLF